MKPSVFQAIDLDRTLFNTSHFVELIMARVEEWEPGLGKKLEARFEEAYKNETTFFALDFIRQRFGDEKYEGLIATIAAETNPDELLLPGARERLARADELSDVRPSFGIVTYTNNASDQLMKLRLVGLENVPLMITDTPHKAKVIESWQQADGTFRLPQEFGSSVVETITLEDDKLRAFVGLPDGVQGVWITDRDEAREVLASFAMPELTQYIRYDGTHIK